jgi:hypothetical protein
MFQDIKIPKKSLREVLPGHAAPASAERAEGYEPPARPRSRRASSRRRWPLFLTLLVILVVGGALWRWPTSATVVLQSKTFRVPVDETLLVYASSTNPADVVYTVVTPSPMTASEEVAASGQKNISVAASGQILIYNNYGAAPQKLVASTRFESKDGKIFRVKEAVTVPGRKGGGPGVVEATVYADKPGNDYNLGLVDFTVPGFKGSPQFEKIYARSKTPLQGGFVGQAPEVAAADLSAAEGALQAKLRQQLLDTVRQALPADQILYDDAAFFSFTTRPAELPTGAAAGAAAKAKVTVEGRLRALVLPRVTLGHQLIGTKVPELANLDFGVDNLEALTFAFNNKNTVNPDDNPRLSAHLTGAAQVTALTDVAKLRADLAGQPRAAVNEILAKTPSLVGAEVGFFPPWSLKLPADENRITVRLDH